MTKFGMFSLTKDDIIMTSLRHQRASRITLYMIW